MLKFHIPFPTIMSHRLAASFGRLAAVRTVDLLRSLYLKIYTNPGRPADLIITSCLVCESDACPVRVFLLPRYECRQEAGAEQESGEGRSDV